MAYPELDVLRAHINTLYNESIVSFLHNLKFVQKLFLFRNIVNVSNYKQLLVVLPFFILGESRKEEEMMIPDWPLINFVNTCLLTVLPRPSKVILIC